MESLNSSLGGCVSLLEATLIMAKKELMRASSEGKKGIVISKGCPNEVRITYGEGIAGLEAIRSFFGMYGQISIGVCDTCKQFDRSGYSTDDFGQCSGQVRHRFYSCSQHSVEGGGYGKCSQQSTLKRPG